MPVANTPPPAPTLPVPGAHDDDASIAGEEDPGAGLEELIRPTPAPTPPGPTPGRT